MKKLLSLVLIGLLILNNTALAEIISIDKLGGLARNPKADRIADGEHDKFQNVFLDYGNLQVVKGRTRLNSTAHTDAVVNGMWYYENASGSTKKIVVAESDELVTYDTDGTNRTSIANTLTNEAWDAVLIGNTLYLTSSTNGLYKWTGSGSATAVSGLSSTPTTTSSASATVGGLTSGLPAIVGCKGAATAGTIYTVNSAGACTLTNGFSGLYDSNNQVSGTVCGSLSATYFNKLCATSSLYKYKATFYNQITGIESEAGSSVDVSLEGPNNVVTTLSNPLSYYGVNTCLSNVISAYQSCNTDVGASGQTSTSGTVSSVSSPYDAVKLYRTTAGGSDFFLVNILTGTTFTDGKPDNALSTSLDTTIDLVSPPSYRFIEEYKGVIVLAEGNQINLGKLPIDIITDADRYWLATDELQVVGIITGLVKAADSLVIFTTKNIYQLTGFGVDSFRLVPIINGIGAVNDETIEVDPNGDVYFFSGTEGAFKLTVGQQPIDNLDGATIGQRNSTVIKVSSPNMDSVFNGDDSLIDLDPANYPSSHAYYDHDTDYYHLYIGQDEFMFDPTHKAWSHVPATKMLASMWRKSPSSAGKGVLVDNLGFFFHNKETYAQGVTSGTVTGNPTSSTSSTLTCSTCNFNTTGDGLKGIWVFVDNELGEYKQITSNTGTTLTLVGTWNVNPTTSDKFYVGYVIPNWRTKQYSIGKPPAETHVTHFYINHNKAASAQEVFVYSYQEKSDIAVNAFNDGGSLDFSSKFIHVVNTRMRSSWVQWEMKSFVYNTSNTVAPPIDVVSYAIDAEQKERVN